MSSENSFELPKYPKVRNSHSEMIWGTPFFVHRKRQIDHPRKSQRQTTVKDKCNYRFRFRSLTEPDFNHLYAGHDGPIVRLNLYNCLVKSIQEAKREALASLGKCERQSGVGLSLVAL